MGCGYGLHRYQQHLQAWTRVYQPSVITSFACSRPNGITHNPDLASKANTGRPRENSVYNGYTSLGAGAQCGAATCGDLLDHRHGPVHHRQGDAAVRGLHLEAGAYVQAELVQPAAAQLEVGNNLGGRALIAVRIRQRAYAVVACGAGAGFALWERVIGFVFLRRQHLGHRAGLSLAGMTMPVGRLVTI